MTRDQQRATRAHSHISNICALPDGVKTKYGTLCMKAPIMLKTIGLLQMLEFICSRDEPAAMKFLGHLASDVHDAKLIGDANEGSLRAKVRNADLLEYMRLTHELDATLLWYRRFAQSLLKASTTDEAGES